jgi:hypothetical protein
MTRGRRLAGAGGVVAIEVEALRLARNLGVPFVRTNNDLTNAPMLAINQKLGYRLRPGVIGFERVPKSG